MMAHKSKKEDEKDKSCPCPFCRGSGKINFKRGDTDIWGPDSSKLTCPICHGRGRIRHPLQYYLRPVRLRFKRQPRRIPFRWSSSGRHGRLSRSPIILPLSGTPLAGWPEGDMVPKTSIETPSPGENVNYNIMDNENPDEDDFPQDHCQAILRISDNITIIPGEEFTSNLVLDIDTVQTNIKEALEASSESVTARICYGIESNEYQEVLLSQINPFKDPTIIQLDDDVYAAVENKEQLLNVEPYEAHISQYNAPLGLDVINEPVPELTIQPHQPVSADFTDVLGPAMSGQVNPLDVTGVEDPLGFDINTDVTGGVGC